MIRVVFDTSVLFSAIFKSTGLEASAFNLVITGLLVPCVSPEVLNEYREVLLQRPTLRPHAQRALHVVKLLTSVAIHVTPTEVLAISNHEADNRFYECADAADASYIITGNLRHFPKAYKNTRIVNARQLLKIVETKRE